MFISWSCGAPFCNFEYLIQGNSLVFFSRKCIFCLRILWVLFCGFLCAVHWYLHQFSSVQSLSRVRLFETLWIAACQASLSITNSWSLLRLMCIKWWCHPAIFSSFVPFSSCPQSLPAPWSFPMSQHFSWGGQTIGVSAAAPVLPINIQDWSPFGWTGCIFLQSKGFSKIFSNTTV